MTSLIIIGTTIVIALVVFCVIALKVPPRDTRRDTEDMIRAIHQRQSRQRQQAGLQERGFRPSTTPNDTAPRMAEGRGAVDPPSP